MKGRCNIKLFLQINIIAFLIAAAMPVTVFAQFSQNYDELHDGYAVSSAIHPGTDNVILYIQKIFPADGTPVFYAFTAYDNTRRCLFTDGSTVTFTVDGQSFYPSVRFFSRQIRNFPSVQTAARYEFILSSDLVDKLADAQTVVITSDSINYQLSTEEVDELHRVIARTHY